MRRTDLNPSLIWSRADLYQKFLCRSIILAGGQITELNHVHLQKNHEKKNHVIFLSRTLFGSDLPFVEVRTEQNRDKDIDLFTKCKTYEGRRVKITKID